jgi:ATP-dependent helicase/nuclease subunit A
MSDENARHAIRTALDTTMMVEAGAGSGKTTLMVDRLVAYAVRGTPVDELAAVTFTRKAANELRERFESRLEAESRSEQHSDGQRALLQIALRNRERMFIGTVHAFCARALREHALDAGLPLDFTELDELESKTLRAQSWQNFLERNTRAGDTRIGGLAELGVDALALTAAFEQYESYRDIAFSAPHAAKPHHETVRATLVSLIQRGYALRQLVSGTKRDELQKTMDRLWNGFHTHKSWEHPADFARDTATLLSASRRKVTQKHWGESKAEKGAAKSFAEDVDAFATGALADWFALWWAYVYPHIIALFHAASHEALLQRRRAGQLGFDDLLTEMARLLRDNGNARRALGMRWRHLLVDEFQDTDPVQAEVCFLLASDVDEGADWRMVKVRPGSLFVVGDPKQSIYRFRRADLATYRLVETRIASCGEVVRLTQNFRSVAPIGLLVNSHFHAVFVQPTDEAPSQYQAPFAEFIAASARRLSRAPAIAHYLVGPAVKVNKEAIVAEDAAKIASWIAARCNSEADRRPQDFLVLTTNKRALADYAHQLSLRNVPVSVSGASSAADGVIAELLIVVRALADPANAVAVIAALEGWCFGCSHTELWDARACGLEFCVTHAPNENESAVGSALQQLYEWWIASQRLLPASLVERILDDSGLLLLAASGDLGDRSGGQLLQIVSVLRDGVAIASDLTSAIAAIERALEQDDSDATLRAGRDDAVRLMNLHKAKGLEAPVVVLVAPVEPPHHEPTIATWRDANDDAAAAMVVTDDRGTIVAQPIEWARRLAEETERQDAERDRLLYVAVTRAQDELVVARRAPFTVGKAVRHDASAWAPLAGVLDAQSTLLELVVDEPVGRNTLSVTAPEMNDRVQTASARLQHAKRSHYEIVSVTEAAKRSATDAREDGASLQTEVSEALQTSEIPFDGSAREARVVDDWVSSDVVGGVNRTIDIGISALEFGALVHSAIEGALRGRSAANVAEYVGAMVWHQFANLSETQRARVARGVLDAFQQARASSVWRLLVTNGALAELNVANFTEQETGAVLTEGVIDAAAQTTAQWMVVDWKNNAGTDAGWATSLPAYTRQARAYLDTLEKRTGMGGSEHIVRIR